MTVVLLWPWGYCSPASQLFCFPPLNFAGLHAECILYHFKHGVKFEVDDYWYQLDIYLSPFK